MAAKALPQGLDGLSGTGRPRHFRSGRCYQAAALEKPVGKGYVQANMTSTGFASKLRIAGWLWLLWAMSGFAATLPLVPLPQVLVVSNSGAFTLCPAQVGSGAPAPAPTLILTGNTARETGEYLAALLFQSTGYRFQVGTNVGAGPVPGAILLTTNSALPSLGAEGYELTVATDSVVVRAPAAAGLFYGVQTLLQLLPPEIYSPQTVSGINWTSPCVYVRDWPRFSWRGFMLDPVRHFWTKDEVKQILDSLAIHKLNVMHLHLDDDSGWRLEIKKYPLLTDSSAWRSDIMWNLNPRSSTAWRDSDGLYGGFYTQQDARELVAYAAQRHITLVPEIEMPGHSSSALNAYPQYSCGCLTCSNFPHSLNVTSYVGGCFCIARPETTNFLQDILTEVMEIFPSQYIHVGGDEVNFGNWGKHSLDTDLMSSLGFPLTTAGYRRYQGWFAQNMANWIKSQGRTMIGWSEIFNGGLVTNCALMDWLGNAAQAATNGQLAVSALSSTLYVNKWETATNTSGGGVVWSNEPPAQSGLCPLSAVYAFDPVPSTVTGVYTNYILGAEGPCWTEWIPSLLNMQFRMYPRLSAIAELNWTAPGLKDWTSFTNRLVTHQRRLDQMGVNYNPYTTPPEIASWGSAPASYATYTWDITSHVTAAGDITASFCWKTGSHGLDIAWAALLENGVELDRDTHAGFTGFSPLKPVYVLRLPARRPGATYSLSALVQGRGGTNSIGVVYLPNWD